jgi:hypothetical protein
MRRVPNERTVTGVFWISTREDNEAGGRALSAVWHNGSYFAISENFGEPRTFEDISAWRI